MSFLGNFYEKFVNNVVLEDKDGNPSVFVKHVRQKSSEFDPILPDHWHPAFYTSDPQDWDSEEVDNSDDILIGKYCGSELEPGGPMYSLPNKESGNPTYTITNYIEHIKQFNSKTTEMTIFDHGLLVLMEHKARITTEGNNNSGTYKPENGGYPSFGDETPVLNKIYVYKGYKWKCIKAYNSSQGDVYNYGKKPDTDPEHWQRLEKIGGTITSDGISLTGSGPLSWYFLHDYNNEADLVGNKQEPIIGLRIAGNQVQINPTINNPSTELKDNTGGFTSGGGWYAIHPTGENGGYTLVEPDADTTTVFQKYISSTQVEFTCENYTNSSLIDQRNGTSNRIITVNFKDIKVNTTTMPSVPSILYEIGLIPLPGTTVVGKIKFRFTGNNGTNFPWTLNYWQDAIGIADMNFDQSFSTGGNTSRACRPRMRMTDTNLIPTYTTGIRYYKGQYILYNNTLYKCITDITSTSANTNWNTVSSKFAAVPSSPPTT